MSLWGLLPAWLLASAPMAGLQVYCSAHTHPSYVMVSVGERMLCQAGEPGGCVTSAP